MGTKRQDWLLLRGSGPKKQKFSIPGFNEGMGIPWIGWAA